VAIEKDLGSTESREIVLVASAGAELMAAVKDLHLPVRYSQGYNTSDILHMLQVGHLLLLDTATMHSLGDSIEVSTTVLGTTTTHTTLLPSLPLHTWAGLPLSLLLTSLMLSLLSHLSPSQRTHSSLSLLDSAWSVSCAVFLSLPQDRVQSSSTRILLLGWTIFSASSFLLIFLPGLLHSPLVSMASPLYLSGSKETVPIIHRINMAMLERQVNTHASSSTDRQEDMAATLHTSFLLLLLLLLTSLLLSLGELVLFSWEHRGRQTGWAALVGEIKTLASRTRKRDQADEEGAEEGSAEWKEDVLKVKCGDENCGADQKLLGNEEIKDST
jgi:hypothetical protein